MASIQSKISRGQKYWYIVESRRVNGKPRPVVLCYLGKANDLLRRLNTITDNVQIKSYSHGLVAAALRVAHELDVCTIINRYVNSDGSYGTGKPIRNHLTTGATILLAAVGRASSPTSKRGWYNWAKTTSLEYLLKHNLSKVDSQHFWDLMDSISIEAVEKIEEELLRKVIETYELGEGNLFYDTTNFFTYINTNNNRCAIARRGKNKQKRADLRQVGLALVVTCKDKIPLFHLAYEGNMHDANVFKVVIDKIKNRMQQLKLSDNEHTIVFDRGNNSKENLDLIKKNQLHYVGALTPYHHKSLVDRALCHLNGEQESYRERCIIWDEERSVVAYISNKLKIGQVRGLYQMLEKKEKALKKIQVGLSKPKARKTKRAVIEKKIINLLRAQHANQIINWSLDEASAGRYKLQYSIDQEKLQEIEQEAGLRIIMTDQHVWSNEQIIETYHGQAEIEHTFKNLKNPYHLTLKPQFHWTDQKIIVHYFICMLGYLLSALIWKEAKEKASFNGNLDTLLDKLSNIRLAALLEEKKSCGAPKAIYKLEKVNDEEKQIAEALKIIGFHKTHQKLRGVGVYS